MDATATPVKRATAARAANSLPPARFDDERLAVNVAQLQERVDALEMALKNVDSMANGALDRITSIAKLTLHFMKSPDKARHINVVADALEQICWTAEQAQSCQEGEVRDAGITPDADVRNVEYLRAMVRA